MMTISKVFKIGFAAAVFMVGMTTTARGVDTGGCNGAPAGGAGRGLLSMKGTVLCANCTLGEVQHRQPNTHKLYQFTHRQGVLVMQVRAVNDFEMFEFPAPRLAMRAPDHVFQQLTAEEHLFREVEITGVLNNTLTVDIFRVLLMPLDFVVTTASPSKESRSSVTSWGDKVTCCHDASGS